MVNLKGVVNLGVKIRVVRNVRIVKLEVENTIFRMAEAALPKLNPGLFSSSPIDKIDKSIENFEINSIFDPVFYYWSQHTCIDKVKEPEMD